MEDFKMIIQQSTPEKYCQDNKMHLSVDIDDQKPNSNKGNSTTEIIYGDFDPLEDSSSSIRFDDFGDDFISNHENKIIIGDYVIRRREIWFVCSAVMFFIVCIGLAVSLGLYTGHHHQEAAQEKPGNGLSNYVRVQQCDAQQCFQLSSSLASSMNRHLDPCVDFGEFACGGFVASHPLASGSSYNSMLDITLQKLDEQLRLLIDSSDLESRYSSRDKSSIAFLFKTKQLYHSCVRDIYGARLGAGTLLEIIESIGGWTIFNNWNESSWDVSTTVENISGKLLVEIFFGISVVSDRSNPKQNRVQLSRPTFSERQTLMINFRESYALYEYKKFINATALLLLENEQQRQQVIIANKQQSIKNLIADVIYMENRIYEILDKTTIKLQEVSVKVLQETFPWMRWVAYLKEILPGAQITNETLVFIECFDYLRRISIILQLVPNRSLNNFLMWRLVREFVPYLSLDYQQTLADYNRAVPINGYHSVGERCIQSLKLTVMREGVLSFLYHDIAEQDHHHQQIEEVLQSIRDALFSSDLWFQDAHLTALIKKRLTELKFTMESEILSDSASLNAFYDQLQVTDNYFNNIINIRHFIKAKLSESYHQNQTLVSWFHTISHSFENSNLILIPVHYIHPPFFDIHYPKHVIYARFGTLVAHALLNYVTINGAENFFSNDAHYAFHESYPGLVLNFLKDCTFDPVLNGSFGGNFQNYHRRIDPSTLLKMFAVKASFEAYKSYIRKSGTDTFIPGLGHFSLEQAFFLSMAQTMCENVDPTFMQTAASYGIAVGNQAINRVLGKLEQFITSYHCETAGQTTFSNGPQKCDHLP